jgi:hypothetical protein
MLSKLPVRHVNGGFASTISSFKIEDWQLGVFMLLCMGFLNGTLWTLQAHFVKKFPAPISTFALAQVLGFTMLATTGLLTVRDSSEWVVNAPISISAILYAVSTQVLLLHEHNASYCFPALNQGSFTVQS